MFLLWIFRFSHLALLAIRSVRLFTLVNRVRTFGERCRTNATQLCPWLENENSTTRIAPDTISLNRCDRNLKAWMLYLGIQAIVLQTC
jgi:hypothetical protein